MDTVDRVISVISFLAKDFAFHGVTEIGSELNLSKTTVHRILSALEKKQWVFVDPSTNKYRLDSSSIQFGSYLISSSDLRSLSLAHLHNLAEATNESAFLNLRVALERLYIEQVNSKQELRSVVELNKRFPLWIGASGKVILAYLDEEDITRVLDVLKFSGIHSYISGRIVDVKALRAELVKIKKDGYAITSSERVLGSTTLAAPILGYQSTVVGSISITGPTPRFSVEVANRYIPLVKKAAKDITSALTNSR